MMISANLIQRENYFSCLLRQLLSFFRFTIFLGFFLHSPTLFCFLPFFILSSFFIFTHDSSLALKLKFHTSNSILQIGKEVLGHTSRLRLKANGVDRMTFRLLHLRKGSFPEHHKRSTYIHDVKFLRIRFLLVFFIPAKVHDTNRGVGVIFGVSERPFCTTTALGLEPIHNTNRNDADGKALI